MRCSWLQRVMCTELLQRLMEFQPCLARAVALAAEVDCLVSLAQCARDYGYCRPKLTQDNVLHIKQGKSPSLDWWQVWMLQDQSVMPAGGQGCCIWQHPVEAKAIAKNMSQAAARPESVVCSYPWQQVFILAAWLE